MPFVLDTAAVRVFYDVSNSWSDL